MKNLNNKGYMLVEIILAFVIAIGVTYFMFELIIKLKNKNDDLIVKTVVATDQAIIYNTLMKKLDTSFNCNKIVIDGNKFKYNGEVVIEVSEYAEVGAVGCIIQNGNAEIMIPISVKQLDDNFDVNIKSVLRVSGSTESEDSFSGSSSSSSTGSNPLLPSTSSSSLPSSSSTIPVMPSPSSSNSMY